MAFALAMHIAYIRINSGASFGGLHVGIVNYLGNFLAETQRFKSYFKWRGVTGRSMRTERRVFGRPGLMRARPAPLP